MDDFWNLFAISWQEALAVIASTVVIYVVFLGFVRLFGARVLSQFSTFDALVVIMLGAVAGRVVLMDVPILPSGILGLGTLFLLEFTIGQLGQRATSGRLVNQTPIVLMREGRILHQGLNRAHMTPDELASSLRLAGIRRCSEVQLAVFEPNGRVSVLRTGTKIDPFLTRHLHLPADDTTTGSFSER